MKSTTKDLLIYLSTLIVFAISFILSRSGIYIASGLLVILYAIFLYVYYYIESDRKLLDMRALYSLSWIGGMGISALKLSHLQSNWELLTWVCFYLAYLCFMIGYELFDNTPFFSRRKKRNEFSNIRSYKKGLMFCIRIVTLLSLAAFVLEAAVLQYIPVFSSKPEAYSLFHISGVHYFTVSAIFVLPLCIVYYGLYKPRFKRVLVELTVYSFISIAISVLIVSRALLMMIVVVSFVCYLNILKEIKLRYLIIGGVILIALYVFISISRNHGVDYLNSIYQMKHNTPIFLSQPYIYIANNYDNFNEIVKNIAKHSWGIKSLTPIYSLTGLKFVLNIPTYPIYTTIKELNTSTYLCDVFYDFGVAGVVILSGIVGAVCAKIKTVGNKIYNPIRYVAEGIFTFVLLFSFFNPWFSNPTTWFYFIALIVMYVTVKVFARHY